MTKSNEARAEVVSAANELIRDAGDAMLHRRPPPTLDELEATVDALVAVVRAEGEAAAPDLGASASGAVIWDRRAKR